MLKQRLYIPMIGNGAGEGKLSWAASMIAGLNGQNVTIDVSINDSHPDRARNRAAANFLESGCDAWVNIDADIEFTAEHLRRLISHDLPLVFGVYPKKNDLTEACLSVFEGGIQQANGLMQVRRCGAGFMCVRRGLLEMMKEENGGPAEWYDNHGRREWNFFPSGVVGREWLSEDWYFCDRATALGVPVLVDPSIVLAHEGPKMYRFAAHQVASAVPKEIKTWRDIPGWFDYEDVYRRIASGIPDNGKFAEIGVFMGKSLAAFDEFARCLSKSVRLFAVDTFEGTPGDAPQAELIARCGGSLDKCFTENMRSCGVASELLAIYRAPSVEAASKFSRNQFDAVFIDAEHTASAVEADIRAWLAKVKPGGILAGHDYDYPEVRRGVHEALVEDWRVETIGRCWFYRVP